MANIAVQKAEGGKLGRSGLLEDLERQLDEVRRRAFGLFERRGRAFGHELEDWFAAERETNGWPAAELTEVDSKYNLSMTLPGYDPKDVQVTVTPSEIIVHANLDSTKKPENQRCLWSEFQSNDVFRRIELPEAIDVDKTAATLEKGMLHVSAAKSAKVQPKTVEVKSA
ncbi:MAG TPA: Hsp20/alpha crystallin family protein [Bryobacteraceae bacterium]|nr:Hsp20/alpha crystallin family protein [Bryobacteraceae bacterium]